MQRSFDQRTTTFLVFETTAGILKLTRDLRSQIGDVLNVHLNIQFSDQRSRNKLDNKRAVLTSKCRTLYLEILHFFNQLNVFLRQSGFVAGDIDDRAIQFLDLDVQLRHVYLEFLYRLYRHQLFLSDIVELSEEFVYFLLEFGLFLVSPEMTLRAY